MEARKLRNIKPGYEYDYLFPKATGRVYTVKKNATLTDTVRFIPKVVRITLPQTKRFAEYIKGNNVSETCQKLWHFIYNHIQYKKDKNGYEQIRSPRRVWRDRTGGVDCDCYSVFISSVLTNLNIPHTLRITKYSYDHFQHIYPIVPYNGRYITVDCVTDRFDYEVPFSEKKDYPMELQFLDGIDGPLYQDPNDFMLMGAGDGMEELGRLIKKNMAKGKTATPAPAKPPVKLSKKARKTLAKSSPAAPAPAGSAAPAPKKKKGIFKKVLNVVNKVNPATVLLRNGLLAAMKLNVKNVAARLRWSYLSPEQAAAKGVDPMKYQKLLATRQKLEKIFFGAGGKEGNLKKAILGGKGNKDKAVNGLGMLPMNPWSGYMNENTPLQQLLGPEIYYTENVEGMDGFQGFGELGEPLTLTSVGAAMGVIAGIVASLKQIGDIFKNKQKGSEDFDEAKTDAPENSVNVPSPASSAASVVATASNAAASSDTFTINPDSTTTESIRLPSSSSSTAVQVSPSSPPLVIEEEPLIEENTVATSTTPATNTNTETGTSNTTTTPPEKETFWDKNKKWLKPVAIGVGGLTLIAIGISVFKANKAKNKSSPKQNGLSGTPQKRKKNGKKKKSVALL